MRHLSSALLVLGIAAGVQADTLRAQILASDKRVCAAMKKKDFVKMAQLIKPGVTSNFVYIEEGVSGKPQTFDQMMTNMKMGLSQMGKLTVVDSKLLTLKETGKTATSTSKHTLGGMTPGPDKKMHLMVMTGISTESYVKDGAKWKMSKMVWKNGAMTMDGKPMDPSKMGGH